MPDAVRSLTSRFNHVAIHRLIEMGQFKIKELASLKNELIGQVVL